MAIPEGAVTGTNPASGTVGSSPMSLVIQIGFDMTVTIRNQASSADVTFDWHTGSAGPAADTLTMRASTVDGTAVAAISNYTSAPTYGVFYNPSITSISGSWAVASGNSSAYDFSLPLSTFSPGQYVYKLLQGSFKDTNGAMNTGYLSDGTDPTGTSVHNPPVNSATVLVGFRTDISFKQNSIAMAAGQWIDPAITGLQAVMTINGAGAYASSYNPTPPSFISVFTNDIASSPSVSSNGLLSGNVGTGVWDSTTVIHYPITSSSTTYASTYTFAATQGKLCNGLSGASLVCNAPAFGTLNVGWKPVVELVAGVTSMTSTYTISSTASISNNFWVSRTNIGSDNGAAGVVTVRVLPNSGQGVSTLAYSSAATLPAWGSSGSQLFDSSRHTGLGTTGAAVPGIVDSVTSNPSALGLVSAYTPDGDSSNYLYQLDISANLPGAYTITLPEGVLTAGSSSSKNCPQTITLKIGFDMSLIITDTSGTDITSTWRTGAGGAGDIVKIRTTANHGKTLLVYSSITPTVPTYSNVFYGTSLNSYSLPLASSVASGQQWTLGGSNSYYDIQMSLASQAPGQYRYALLDGVFKDVNGAGNVGYLPDTYGVVGLRGTVPGVGSAATPLVDLKIGFVPTRSFNVGGSGITPTQWQDPQNAINYVVSAASSYFQSAYVSLASNIPALDVAANSAAGVQVTVVPTLGAGYRGIAAADVTKAAVGTTTIDVTYTIAANITRWAGKYTLTIPQGKYDNGLTGASLIANAPVSDQLYIGFRPTLSILAGNGGAGTLLTDNRPVGATNQWVSKTAATFGSGTVTLKVTAPAAGDPLGTDQGVNSLYATAPGFVYTAGGLFSGSSVPSFTYTSPTSGTATLGLATSATGATSGYLYPIQVNAASVKPGVYVFSLVQGAVKDNSADALGSYPVTVTLKVGWDAQIKILKVSGSSVGSDDVTNTWLGPSATAYLHVGNSDTANTGTLRPLTDSGYATSASGSFTYSTPTFPSAKMGGLARGGTNNEWVESLLDLSTITPGSYDFTIQDGVLQDANLAGNAAGFMVKLLVGYVVTPTIVVNTATWTSSAWYDGTQPIYLKLASTVTMADASSPSGSPSIANGFTVTSAPTASTGITSVSAISSASGITDLSFRLGISAGTSASVYTFSVVQGKYNNGLTGYALAYNAAPSPITLNIGFKPTLQVLLGTSGVNMATDSSPSATNYWISRSAVPTGSGTAGHVRLTVIPDATQGGVSTLFATPPSWGTASGNLFDSSRGGAAPSLSNGATVYLPGTPAASGGTSGYSYDVTISTATPGWYNVDLPEGTVKDSTGSVRNCPVHLLLQVGFDLTLTLRDNLGNDVTGTWHTGATGPVTETLTMRVTTSDPTALSAISNYTGPGPVAPGYGVFYSPLVTGISGAWTAPSTSTYEFTLPLTTFQPGQYVYKLLQGSFKDANGAINVGYLSDGNDPTGGSLAGITSATLKVGFRTDVTFEQNSVPIAAGQWIDPDQTISANSLLNAVLTISNGAGTYYASYPTSAPTFSSLFSVTPSTSVGGAGITSGGSLVRSNNTVVRYSITTSVNTAASAYTFATTQGALCDSLTAATQICNAPASNTLNVGWKPVMELVAGNAVMGDKTFLITATNASANNFWVARTSVGSNNGAAGIVTLRIRPSYVQNVGALSTSGIPAWAASGGALFDSARHKQPGATGAAVPFITDSTSTLTLRSGFTPAANALHALYELDISTNVPGPYTVSV